MWSSRWVFVLAVTGAAMGLGNIWSFAAVAGAHGGGAFVFVYLVCLTVFGIPLMMAEILLGRVGRLSPINTLRRLTRLRRASACGSRSAGPARCRHVDSFFTGVFAGWALLCVRDAARQPQRRRRAGRNHDVR
jgi:NSS family neurotransmitter:Na+ symporter